VAHVRVRLGRTAPRTRGPITTTSSAPRSAAAILRAAAPWLAACERRLCEAVAGHAPEVTDPATDTLLAGGKRVRPLLVFCSASLDVDESRADALVSAAAAVELVHMATLVHDDLIDGASLRRGRPTVARALGAETAVRVGDFLFARAFAELTRTGEPRAVHALAEAALDLSLGEMAQQGAAFDLQLTEAAYLHRCRRKTAALFAVACRLGALVSGADEEAEGRLAAFGENVGMAFQIFDDILDLAGTPAATGKRRGTDLRGGTVTLPVIMALREEPGLAAAIATAGSGSVATVEPLCDRLAAHAGVALARERALSFVAAARASLDGPVNGADRGILLQIADGVVDRYS
jgi:geranylgeranyl pyrophosphate synthase